MPPLVELQSRFRAAMVTGDSAQTTALLVGGRDPQRRLAIHQRHYEASLVGTLLRRFPALVWLVGSRFVTDAAREFVHRRPPASPCLAEYGADFPGFVAARPAAEGLQYLRSFAELEWSLGEASLAVDCPPIGMDALARVRVDMLPDVVLRLQPYLRYVEVDWPVDELIECYLSGRTPDRFVMNPTHIGLQIRGARGAFRIHRVAAGDFVFRRMLLEARPLGVAAANACESDPNFDAGRALSTFMADGLVSALEV
jgi:Putative DNA-binding domain